MSENSFVYDVERDLWWAFEDRVLNTRFGLSRIEIVIEQVDGVWYSCVYVLGCPEMGRRHESLEAAKAYYGR